MAVTRTSLTGTQVPHPPRAEPGRVEGIRAYFEDRSDRWIRLTSGEEVSGVRARVRAGRARMATTLMGWVLGDEAAPHPDGLRVLDAGCGPGEVSVRLAARGARVTGVEVAPSLVATARERVEALGLTHRIDVMEGDASRAPGGPWDAALVMDVLFHYPPGEAADFLARMAPEVGSRIVFTVGPRTPLLAFLQRVGGLFPRSDRAPVLHLVRPRAFVESLLARPDMKGWTAGRSRRVSAPFYASHALEIVRTGLDGAGGADGADGPAAAPGAEGAP
ncbi:MAG: magnesium protoporphyrin IX methyltransferase [Gemmatimonadales bacterium]|nr:MAG: magnesium protoporphyrin IX methyltransferase [Gemmatimonadales bacterium]